MSRCLIITSHIDGFRSIPELRQEDWSEVIAADGGLKLAENLGLEPTALIGDYDSMEKPDRDDLILLPREKDMTDTEAALDLAVSRGHKDIVSLGGLGGRFDHTMGNIGLLLKCADSGCRVSLEDGFNRVSVLNPGQYTVKRDRFYYLGLIAYGNPVIGLTVEGAKYPLNDYTLPANTTLGVSNEILGSSAKLSFLSGRLMVIQSNDAKE